MSSDRRASVSRATTETQIEVTLDLDGGPVKCETGVPFFDHMLAQLGTHGRLGLTVRAVGDLEIDAHHTVEDCGIVLGEALSEALRDKRGIRRYGDALVPMEESLARVAVDISGRPLLVYNADVGTEMVGQYDVSLTEEFLLALCRSGGLTLHVDLLRSKNAHHAVEAIFKGVARALNEAVRRDDDAIPST
ncbi:MAG: imidazoleglycerol-phosphate dehydratase HisB, partial [Actinomycetota bacterium]|nr:imidazoleglycerol-phosphate dehydratase HisB [Actinomycetota bacterium]